MTIINSYIRLLLVLINLHRFLRISAILLSWILITSLLLKRLQNFSSFLLNQSL